MRISNAMGSGTRKTSAEICGTGSTTGMVPALQTANHCTGSGVEQSLEGAAGTVGANPDGSGLQATQVRKGRLVAVKQKRCKVCKTSFEPTKPMQAVCGLGCALTLALCKRKLLEAKERRETAKADRVKREKLKTKGEYIKEAQSAFNKYVRLRDAGKGCVSCESDCGSTSPGGSGDAGHFRSRGSAPHLRFDERNVHLQCKRCNRYLSGNVANYRIGLIERIGQSALDELEADQTSRNYTIDDLKNIKAIYTAKCKELEKSIV